MALLIGSAAKYEQGGRVVASKGTIHGPCSSVFCLNPLVNLVERTEASHSRAAIWAASCFVSFFFFFSNICLYAS